MKKHLFSAITAATMAAVTGLTLTACDGKTDGNGNCGQGGQEISEVITQAQWNAAFGVENFLRDAKIVYTQVAQDMTQKNELRLGGDACGSHYVKNTFTRNGVKESESEEVVIVGDEYTDNYYKYSDNDSGSFAEGEWNYHMGDAHDYAANDYELWKSYVLDNVDYDYFGKVAERYADFVYGADKFTYNGGADIVLLSEHEEDGGATLDSSLTANDVAVTISDGKLSSVTMTCKYIEELTGAGDEDYSENIDFTVTYAFTYAPQAIEAPEGVKPMRRG